MHGSEDAVVDTLRQWVEKAENDLKTAEHVLTLGEDCPTDTVCFHAQQCVEKYQKALLVLNRIDFSKTHDLNALARLMPDVLLPMLTDEQRRRLTEYATVSRYPGDDEPLALSETRVAVQLARRVRARVRKLLPRESLRRRNA